MSRLPEPFAALGRRWLTRLAHRHGLPLREGNAASLLEGGEAWLGATEALIRGARVSLRFEMYHWADDEVGRRVAGWFREALARGVAVQGIVDALASFGSGGLLEDLRRAGAEIRRFHPVGLWRPVRVWNRRNHRKLLLADGLEAAVGSANWGLDYDGARNPEAFLDVGVALRGPSVQDLEGDFQRLWRRLGGRPGPAPAPPGRPLWGGEWVEPVTVQVVTSLSRLGVRAIRRHLKLLVGQARTSLWIANAYFVPGPVLLRLLGRAARRGVDLRILVPGHTDQPFVQAAGRRIYGPLLRAGARIFERQGRMLHAKAALVDGEWALIGSANLDPRSFRHNLELNLALHHPDLAARLRGHLEAQLGEAQEIRLEAWEGRSWRQRLWQELAYACRWWL